MNKRRRLKTLQVLYIPTKKKGFIYDYSLSYINFPVYFDNGKKIITTFEKIKILKNDKKRKSY